MSSQVLQFPPALYHYVTGELQKQVIVVLNKVDLCPAPLVLAWKHYLSNHFPHLHCICFTSHPGQPYNSCECTPFAHRNKGLCCCNIPVEGVSVMMYAIQFFICLLSLYLSCCCSVSEKANEEEEWVGPGRRTHPHYEGMSGDHGWKRSDILTL